jgi:hypothetical protein
MMSNPVTLKCPNCGSVLRTDDIDAASGIIKCSYCKALATLPNVTDLARGDAPFHPRADVPLPPGLTLEQYGGGISITRRWFSAIVFFLIPFCIAWDAFLVFWYSMALSGNAPWIMVVFPIAHVAVGVGMTYFTFATLFNRTVIIAGQGSLRIGHGPLPWRGGVELAESDIDQLFCKMKTRSGKSGPSISYEVWAVMREGATRKLFSTGESDDQALFIEQRIERALGIKDRAVPGELPR